jgi:DNA mismatch endonuclease (patch repair protein)
MEAVMADRITKEHRSWNMSRIRGKDTDIEKMVRSYLFSRGFRFRKNDKRYPGKPDVVLPKYRTVIFVNGCFWHRHEGCKRATTPKTNVEFWEQKFARNVARDRATVEQLEAEGWKVLTIWECELEGDAEQETERLLYELMTLDDEPKERA